MKCFITMKCCSPGGWEGLPESHDLPLELQTTQHKLNKPLSFWFSFMSTVKKSWLMQPCPSLDKANTAAFLHWILLPTSWCGPCLWPHLATLKYHLPTLVGTHGHVATLQAFTTVAHKWFSIWQLGPASPHLPLSACVPVSPAIGRMDSGTDWEKSGEPELGDQIFRPKTFEELAGVESYLLLN